MPFKHELQFRQSARWHSQISRTAASAWRNCGVERGDAKGLVRKKIEAGPIKFKRVRTTALVLVVIAGCAIADEPWDATCRIIFKDDYNRRAPCTISTKGDVITVEGELSADGRRFIAVVDTGTNEGALTTFLMIPLAYGKLLPSEPGTYAWDNGHTIIVEK